MPADDERPGQLVRLLRRRSNKTQVELAKLAGVPLNDLKSIEAGNAGVVALDRIRRVLEAEGGKGRLTPWWNGAAADRLLDERHAALVERCVAVFRTRGWQVAVEVSFSQYGERGSIDILAAHEWARAVAVCEVKSAFGSLEETNRMLDVKERLAPRITFERLGWRPAVVGRLLIVPRTSAIRGVVSAHAATMSSLYPARSREVRAWLRHPVAAISGIWFVSDGRHASTVSA